MDKRALGGEACKSSTAINQSDTRTTESRIARLFEHCLYAVDLKTIGKYDSVEYLQLQLALFTGQSPPPLVQSSLAQVQESEEIRPCTCLLCQHKPFASRQSLTCHTSIHSKKSAFVASFNCPRCRERVPPGADSWCTYVEKHHGVDVTAPNIRTLQDLGNTERSS